MTEEKERLINTIGNAEQAEQLLASPLLQASLNMLRDLTVEKFENLGFSQTLEMQECNLRLGLIEEFTSHLTGLIQNKDYAYSKLEEIQTHQQELDNER